MSYTPNNTSVYLAAFSGALAGLGQPAMADAFAQELDTLWGVTAPTSVQLLALQEMSSAAWAGRSPLVQSVALIPGAYSSLAAVIVSLAVAGNTQVVSQGIDPNIPSSGGVSAVTATAPITSSGGTTPTIGIAAATDSVPGSMSAVDKTKLDGLSSTPVNTVAGMAPIVSSGGQNPAISISPATDSTAGSLSAADKTKLDSVAVGAAVSAVTGTAPIVSSGGDAPAISISAATDSTPGSMSAADKTKLDGISSTPVASVTGTAPIVSSGGQNPAISISPATDLSAGSMSAADKTKLDGLSPSSIPFAQFFALMPGDNTATVATGTAVMFPQVGPTSGAGAPTALGASTFNLPNIGSYEVNWQVSVTEAGQLQLAIGGVGLPDTVVGRGSGNSQLVGSCIITTSVVNSVLSVINPPANSTALTITPVAGGATAVSATLSIKQIG